MLELKGTLSINRVCSNKEETYVSLNLNDENSHCNVVEIKISMKEFAQAVTGLNKQPCSFEYNNSGVIGRKKEYKKELVALPNFPYNVTDDVVKAALTQYETDGWQASVYDAKNHKNIIKYDSENKINIYDIGFVRYIEDKTVILKGENK